MIDQGAVDVAKGRLVGVRRGDKGALWRRRNSWSLLMKSRADELLHNEEGLLAKCPMYGVRECWVEKL